MALCYHHIAIHADVPVTTLSSLWFVLGNSFSDNMAHVCFHRGYTHSGHVMQQSNGTHI